MKLKHYVEYYYCGILVDETESKEIKSRDIELIKTIMPKNAFGFSFFDKAYTEEGGIKFSSKTLNESPMYYVGGKVMNENDVRNYLIDNKILISNMHSNNWKQVIKTRSGNFKPFTKKDILLEQ